jgi:hypothetical protein
VHIFSVLIILNENLQLQITQTRYLFRVSNIWTEIAIPRHVLAGGNIGVHEM